MEPVRHSVWIKKPLDLSRKNPERRPTCTRLQNTGILFQTSVSFQLTEDHNINLLGPMCELNVLPREEPGMRSGPERGIRTRIHPVSGAG